MKLKPIASFVPFRAFVISLSLVAASGLARPEQVGAAEPGKKVVFLAGRLDAGHPRGTHEYERAAALLKLCLDMSPDLRGVRTEVHLSGWPNDPVTLDDADTIVVITNG